MEEIGVQWTSGPFLNGPIYGFQQTNQNSIVAGSTTSPLPPVGASGLRGGGLEGQIAVLSQPQLSAIFNAVERTGRLRTLQAPSVTTVSGVRAVAGFVEQVGYIASYDVTDQNYDPVVDVLNLGAVIDVRPIVSADRRYVTMELQPAIASAEFFIETITTVPYAGGVPLGATPVDVDGDGLVDYYLGGTAQPYNLELPNIALRRLAATVQVPDRGTLIMGGFGSHLEQFSTSRVPVLGDVPFLGRLFGARGRYGQRLQWNLLVTATILPYDELEIQQ
jgi:type II secretory pathway component GspD/PulD (secretin)